MHIEDLWKRLANYGVDVPCDVQRRIGLDCNQERVCIRPPATTASGKARVLAYGTGVSSEFIARQTGVSVRYVQKIRKVLRG